MDSIKQSIFGTNTERQWLIFSAYLAMNKQPSGDIAIEASDIGAKCGFELGHMAAILVQEQIRITGQRSDTITINEAQIDKVKELFDEAQKTFHLMSRNLAKPTKAAPPTPIPPASAYTSFRGYL